MSAWIVRGILVLSLLGLPVGQGGLLLADPAPEAQTPKAEAKPSASQAPDSAAQAQAKRLLDAVRAILDQAAAQRKDQRRLPSKKDYLLIAPPWTETREDREKRIRELLDAALEIVTDVPITRIQKRITQRRAAIRDLKDRIAVLKEKRLTAPTDGFLPGIVTDTVASLDEDIADLQARIAANRQDIAAAKREILAALEKSGIQVAPDQLDLMLDSVLGGDMIKLVAAFETVKNIDAHLGQLVRESGENLKAARRYFALHATLFAMLVHAQDMLIDKINRVYLKRLDRILADIREARAETDRLMRGANRPDQQRTLAANRRAQLFAQKVARYYRDFLKTQRRQLIQARQRTMRDLRIADNTYRTVEASFQLRALIEDARASFDAIKKLETPGFDQIFQNDRLRKEFEKLTDQLAPTS